MTKNLNHFSFQTDILVQQRYILGAMIFIIYGMSAVYRSGFPLILTQMVYIPNSGSNSNSSDSNGELICPIRRSTPKNVTSNSVRKCFIRSKLHFFKLFVYLIDEFRLMKLTTVINGHRNFRV